MKLRRRYDDLASEVSNLAQQRELLLTQMLEEKAEWEKLHRVSTANKLLAPFDKAAVPYVMTQLCEDSACHLTVWDY